jgi:HEAT repeat protein
VRDAAARALGRIGGTASAEALLRAIRRDRPTRTLIVELARAAPDLFLETALCSPKRAGTRSAVVIAAGLRGRRAAVSPLLALLVSGNRKERAVACRALGWIRAEIALPTVAASLGDGDWKVRMSAVKALTRLGVGAYVFELQALRSDPDPRVRRTGRIATRRLVNEAARPWRGQWR